MQMKKKPKLAHACIYFEPRKLNRSAIVFFKKFIWNLTKNFRAAQLNILQSERSWMLGNDEKGVFQLRKRDPGVLAKRNDHFGPRAPLYFAVSVHKSFVPDNLHFFIENNL